MSSAPRSEPLGICSLALRLWQLEPRKRCQIVRNLLSNAFKYAPKDSPVTVCIWQDGAFALICVQDKGPGIPINQLPFLFQKFSRLECDIAGPIRGIGLGLYICRRLVENMGGHIWVESTGIDGEGCQFYFTIPCASSQPPKVSHIRLQEQQSGRIRI
jgi:signal transduction histidine kinase